MEKKKKKIKSLTGQTWQLCNGNLSSSLALFLSVIFFISLCLSPPPLSPTPTILGASPRPHSPSNLLYPLPLCWLASSEVCDLLAPLPNRCLWTSTTHTHTHKSSQVFTCVCIYECMCTQVKGYVSVRADKEMGCVRVRTWHTHTRSHIKTIMKCSHVAESYRKEREADVMYI